ncbi:hypothetical protein [Streptomyces sp. NPDC086766]|uniref:hypothetical protein n=1 Tax=Streptomyces sp. NPDC086766 TaxID=3365754 RepID=UPI003815E603
MTRVRLRGRVGVERVAVGSKSERDALVLHCDDRTLILRLEGEPAFGIAGAGRLTGRTIEARGEVEDQYFHVSEWTVVD